MVRAYSPLFVLAGLVLQVSLATSGCKDKVDAKADTKADAKSDAKAEAPADGKAEEAKKFEEVVEDKGVTILIDPAATMFLIGSEMDYQEDKLQSGFVFNNPNEKGRCGCGESFHI